MLSSDAILQQGHPLLRQPARTVAIAPQIISSQPVYPEAHSGAAPAEAGAESQTLQALIDDLIGLTRKANGVGIAAPQVGIGQRLMIVASRPNARYPDAPQMEPTAMINPRLLDRSERTVSGWEGCLSVPGQRGWVPRADQIQVAYWDHNGKHCKADFQGFIARIFQHELDHLDGVLFPDRVARPEDLISEIEFLEQLSRQE